MGFVLFFRFSVQFQFKALESITQPVKWKVKKTEKQTSFDQNSLFKGRESI